MNFTDEQKFRRLSAVFDRNCRAAALFTAYLENCPDLITAEAVAAISGGIGEGEAIGRILCEAMGLNYSDREDRVLINDYILPSVQILSTNIYKNDDFYRLIENIQGEYGNWKIEKIAYPPYRGAVAGDLVLNDDFSEHPVIGFFSEEFSFPAVSENGNPWMTLSPADIDTSREAIAAAHGKVVTYGLGLGYFAFSAAKKPEVESVTVVEKSPEVIALFRKFLAPKIEETGIPIAFAEESKQAKIRIINADAFDFAETVMPQEHFDFCFADIWRDAGDGATLYRRFQALEKLSPHTEFSYWIENFLFARLRTEKFFALREKITSGAPISYRDVLKELKHPNTPADLLP